MQQLHEQGYPEICPDTFSFASVLNALANSPEPNAAAKAEKVLKYMQQLHNEGNTNVAPNTVCFATVIKAYSRSKEKDSAGKAAKILEWMFQVHEEGNSDVRPNTISFTSVCDAWSKSGHTKAVKKVEELISWMEKLSESGFEGVSVNGYTYNTLITAIARSKDPNKATKAFEVLQILKEKPNIHLNSFSYSTVMNACSYTHGTTSVRNIALRTAIIVLEEAVDTADAKDRLNIVYGAFFQTCANLMQKEAEKVRIQKIVETVFRQCCDNGQVDEMLLGQVRRACSKQLYLELFGNFATFPNVKIQDIPGEWRQNVKRRR
jgi:pentatricopeptide repeat protein|eukprot:scaffold10556_cov258-Chaetoceros_neogracile.AAC.45